MTQIVETVADPVQLVGMWQATCDSCGWHTQPASPKVVVREWARLHRVTCPLKPGTEEALPGSFEWWKEAKGRLSATCLWCWREGHHAPDCEGLRRFFAGEAAPVRPPEQSNGTEEDLN